MTQPSSPKSTPTSSTTIKSEESNSPYGSATQPPQSRADWSPPKVVQGHHSTDNRKLPTSPASPTLKPPLIPTYPSEIEGFECLPVFHPTAEQLRDPYDFVESVRSFGEFYGAVKIVPPEEWKDMSLLDKLFSLEIRTVTQTLAQHSGNHDEKMQFYKDLVNFHTQRKTPLHRLPSIDKRVVDLFKLRQSVQAKGGFSNVCSKKLWAQVGRELGYTGRTMTSLSTSLKGAYLKTIYDYDIHLAQQNSSAGPEPDENVNGESKRPINGTSEEGHSLTKSNQDPPSLKRRRLDEANGDSTGCCAYISNSRTVYRRPRDLLKAKGFRTNFQSLTQEIIGITDPDPSTYPYYDFNFWHQGIEVPDHPYPNSELSELEALGSMLAVPTDDISSVPAKVVKDFWANIETQKQYKAKAAYGLSSTVYASGHTDFPDLDIQARESSQKYKLLHPWNLNNIALHEKGVLRYLTSDQGHLTKPSLNFGSDLALQTFSVEDHFLYHYDYLHSGMRKIWYVIDPEDRGKYEEEYKSCIKIHRSKIGESSDVSFRASDPIAQDIFEELEQEDQFDIRASAVNSAFDKFYDHKQSSIKLNSDMILTPNFLKSKGIKLRQTIQCVGEVIIKWPASYSCTVSLGNTVSESVPFAPRSWLDVGMDAELWLAKQGIIPSFSYRQLLCNIIEESKDSELLKSVQRHFDNFVQEEITLRAELKSIIGSYTRVVPNKFDYICDDTLKSSFPTKIVIRSGDDSFNIDPHRLITGNLNTEDLSNFKVEIHVYYTDEKLRSLQRSLATLSQTPADWLEKFEKLLSREARPSLKVLKNLYAESERLNGQISEAETLGKYLEFANSWVETAQEVLNAKQKNRIRNRRQVKSEVPDDDNDKQFDFETLENLVSSIPLLTFTCPEIDQILELSQEIETFEASTRAFVLEAGHTREEFSELIDLGRSFGIKINTVDLLERIVSRWQWLADYEAFNKGGVPSLEQVADLLDRGYELCGSTDSDLLESLSSKITEGQTWSIAALKLLNSDRLPLDELLTLTSCTETIALPIAVRERLEEVNQKHVQARGILSSIAAQMSRNLDELNNFTKMIQMKNSEGFDSNEYDKLLSKYAGREKDSRPEYREAKEAYEKALQLALANDSTSTFFDLASHLEAVEVWQKKAKKIFGKVNAPLHLLKAHLETLNDKIKYAFAVSDKYNPNRSEEDHVLYCFCRRPESGTMVACEKCLEWYHCKCLKFSRGKGKEVDHYICPLCDYRIEIPKEYDTPKLEELQQLMEEGACLKLAPEEIPLIYSMWVEAEAFRGYLKEVLPWDGSKIIGEDLAMLKFYLRKLEGSSILLADEYNQLRQLVWKLDPYGDHPPPIVESGNKTKKKRIPKAKSVDTDSSLIQIDSSVPTDTAGCLVPIIQPVKAEAEVEGLHVLHQHSHHTEKSSEANGTSYNTSPGTTVFPAHPDPSNGSVLRSVQQALEATALESVTTAGGPNDGKEPATMAARPAEKQPDSENTDTGA